jgi:hypothetical protein
MSWLYSQALVAEYLGENFLDGEQSAPLNGKPTPQAYCAPDKMTAFSRLSRFGMMFKPLTANLGEELLMSYLEDFHVPTLVQQEKAQELMEKPQECGEKWLASFAKYDPSTHLLRTHQCSLLEDLDEYCATLPNWGLMRNGECWEQTRLDYPTGENEFGSWLPTPVTSMWRGASKKRFFGSREYKGSFTMEWIRTSPDCAQYFHPDFAELLMDFPDKWTELKPLEMHKFLEWRQQHGESLQKDN